MASPSYHGRPARLKGLYWETTSELDGSPIVVIFTGIGRPSANEKTGAMVQAWILAADADPLETSRKGADGSICGSCPHRWSLGGACYVTLHRAPLQIWRSWRAGAYERLDLDSPEHIRALRRAPLRLGAYGDPAAVPGAFWARFFASIRPASWTGYTHQWRDPRFLFLRRIVMASCDAPADVDEARRAGWRTFRIKAQGDAPLPGEFSCPASAEGGFRLTCEACGACNGAMRGAGRKGSPVIDVHGSRAGRFLALPVLTGGAAR
jgi:hypothetical protein